MVPWDDRWVPISCSRVFRVCFDTLKGTRLHLHSTCVHVSCTVVQTPRHDSVIMYSWFWETEVNAYISFDSLHYMYHAVVVTTDLLEVHPLCITVACMWFSFSPNPLSHCPIHPVWLYEITGVIECRTTGLPRSRGLRCGRSSSNWWVALGSGPVPWPTFPSEVGRDHRVLRSIWFGLLEGLVPSQMLICLSESIPVEVVSAAVWCLCCWCFQSRLIGRVVRHVETCFHKSHRQESCSLVQDFCP